MYLQSMVDITGEESILKVQIRYSNAALGN